MSDLLSPIVSSGFSCSQLAAGAGARFARAICLEIGGANIPGADRALSPPTSSSLGDERRVPSHLLSTAARDPKDVCLQALKARVYKKHRSRLSRREILVRR